MSLGGSPAAATVKVASVIEMLGDQFRSLLEGVGTAQYAFWLGSGISLARVDGLKKLLLRAISYLHERVVSGDPNGDFSRAIEEILEISGISPAEVASIDRAKPPSDWPPIDSVLWGLTQKYAAVLDVQVGDQDEDFLLWTAIDVRKTYASDTLEPDCEHLAIALLAIEGHVPQIVSANWDGLLEAAFTFLGRGSDNDVKVCVSAEDLRGTSPISRLLKFHGCALRAAHDESNFRQMLIHRKSQITTWPHSPEHKAMRVELLSLATRMPTLMIGLSAQDSDIQDIFAQASQTKTWPFPSTPVALVFAEDEIGMDQGTILRHVYGPGTYRDCRNDIESRSLIRAYAKPLLTAITLAILAEKLIAIGKMASAGRLPPDQIATVLEGVEVIRDMAAARADGDRIEFVKGIALVVSSHLSLFRTGTRRAASGWSYLPITATPLHQIETDANVPASGLPELAIALGLVGTGHSAGYWTLRCEPLDAFLKIDTRAGTIARMIFVGSARAAAMLFNNGIVDPLEKDVVVVQSDSPVRSAARSPRSTLGRSGLIRTRQVGIEPLMQEAHSAQHLGIRFREECGL